MTVAKLLAPRKLFNHHIHVAYYWLAAVDAVLFFAACYAGSYIYHLPDPAGMAPDLPTLPLRAATYAVMLTIALFSMGLYQPQLREGVNGVLLRTLGAFGAMTLVMTALFYFLPALHLWRGVFVYTSLISLALFLTTRLLFSNTAELDALQRRVLVLGSGDVAAAINRRMRRKADRRGFKVVGFARLPGEESTVDSGNVFNLSEPLSDYVHRNRIQQIVVATAERRETLPMEELVSCRIHGVDIIEMVEFFEQQAGKVLVDYASSDWLVFNHRNATSEAIKRGFDLAISFVMLMFAWPIMLLTVLAIWLEDGLGAPVIFKQVRVGQNGRKYEVAKFRSMRIDAEKDGKARWATSDDDRITRVGRFIRKTRIDELPQILNVIAGDMSLVGPRPERPEFVRELREQIPFYERRHAVKPGVTGWAQMNYPYGASVEDAKNKLEYDLYYAKSRSLFLDCLILLQTVEVILFGKGAR